MALVDTLPHFIRRPSWIFEIGGLIFLCKFTFPWIIDMPRSRGHCKVASGNVVEK